MSGKPQPKAVVLLSGGMDSATCAFQARADGYTIYALTITYGQRAQREVQAAQGIARAVGAVEHQLMPLDLSLWGGSALTDERLPVPTGGVQEDTIPATYVPARNTIFLSLALAWAEVLDADAIYIGVNSVDYSGYPDCRPEFIAAFQALADLATKRTVEGRPIRIVAPLQHLSKVDIVRRAWQLGVPLNETWSCYQGGDEPCGVCDSCRLREEAIKAAARSMKRCLLLSCSRAKRDTPGCVPAIERYDGPAFRVWRKFVRERPDMANDVDVYVLSAEYGLIRGDEPTRNYDRLMTRQRATELRSEVLARLEEAMTDEAYGELFVSLGQTYLLALDGYETVLPPTVAVTVSRSPFGRKLTELRNWLYGIEHEPGRERPTSRQPTLPLVSTRPVRIRGRQISMTPEEALDVARRALAEGQGDPDRYRTWYVLMDERKVGAKWLVSQLAGLPTADFDASEARRVLRGLGIEVCKDEN